MSSDEMEDVKLYSALEREKRRKTFVSFSSSEDSDTGSLKFTSSPKKRGRPKKRTSTDTIFVHNDSASKKPHVTDLTDANTVVISDDDGDDFMSASEREIERVRACALEAEIQQRLAQDKILNQTRAIMSKISTTKTNTAHDIIDIDSDDDVQILSQPYKPSIAPVVTTTKPTVNQDKGERITLHVRSNGDKTDEINVYSKETFVVLYERFCGLHGLPHAAVTMHLDGEPLKLNNTPEQSDLESGDLIDAKVDFTQQETNKRKRFIRLRLIVQGRRPEVFKIDVHSTLDKLRSSFCKKHNVIDYEDVEMTVFGEVLPLHETVEGCGLLDDDEIRVKVNNIVDSNTIELCLRYDVKSIVPHRVVPTDLVGGLMKHIAADRNVQAHQVLLRLDGENMQGLHAFSHYDLEGGELIDVKILSGDQK